MERAKTPRFDEETTRPASSHVLARAKLASAERRPRSSQLASRGPNGKAWGSVDPANGPACNYWPKANPAKGQELQPKFGENSEVSTQWLQSRKIASKEDCAAKRGDLPLHLDQWFEGELPERTTGLRICDNGPADTLGACAKKPPEDFKWPTKRCHGAGLMRPLSAKDRKPERPKVYLRPIPQKERWREVEKSMGRRNVDAPTSQTRQDKGLRICRNPITGEMCKELRSQVMKFTDLTGRKRDFSHLPGYLGREDPNSWPGWRGWKGSHDDNGKFRDFNIKENGGVFAGKKFTNDVVCVDKEFIGAPLLSPTKAWAEKPQRPARTALQTIQSLT